MSTCFAYIKILDKKIVGHIIVTKLCIDGFKFVMTQTKYKSSGGRIKQLYDENNKPIKCE